MRPWPPLCRSRARLRAFGFRHAAMITPGTTLGRYTVREPIGAGGMGEVYLAFDPELERVVALKVLPADLAGDAARVARFVREAKAASALNHPNILTVFDAGAHDDTRFLVTEL